MHALNSGTNCALGASWYTLTLKAFLLHHVAVRKIDVRLESDSATLLTTTHPVVSRLSEVITEVITNHRLRQI